MKTEGYDMRPIPQPFGSVPRIGLGMAIRNGNLGWRGFYPFVWIVGWDVLRDVPRVRIKAWTRAA